MRSTSDAYIDTIYTRENYATDYDPEEHWPRKRNWDGFIKPTTDKHEPACQCAKCFIEWMEWQNATAVKF